MSDDEYWLTHMPTIADIRRLNRESWLTFPLPFLDALIVGGIDLDAFADAIVRQVVVSSDELLELRWWVFVGNVAMLELSAVDEMLGDGSIVHSYRLSRKHRSLTQAATGKGKV